MSDKTLDELLERAFQFADENVFLQCGGTIDGKRFHVCIGVGQGAELLKRVASRDMADDPRSTWVDGSDG